KNKIAIIDTGASSILASSADVKAVHSSIDGAVEDRGTYYIPCNTTAAVSLQFAGINYNITLVGPSVEENDGLCYSNVNDKQNFNLGIPNAWLVGVPFLKNVYAAFDVINLRVGFALPKTQAIQ